MFRSWMKILPVFVVQWLCKGRIGTVTYGGYARAHQPFKDVLFLVCSHCEQEPPAPGVKGMCDACLKVNP